MLRGLNGVPIWGSRLASLRAESQACRAAGGLSKRWSRNYAAKAAKRDQTASDLVDELKDLTLVPLGSAQTLAPTPLEVQNAELQKQVQDLKAPEKYKLGRKISPSMTWYRMPWHQHLHKGGPVKALTVPKVATSGRNHSGKIVVRHRGGAHKRRVRLVDHFRREGGEHLVVRIEYDPGRSGHIALIRSPTDTYSYIPATMGMRAGDKVESFLGGIPPQLLVPGTNEVDPGALASVTARSGNCLPLRLVPLGAIVCNIGVVANGPARFCRGAGSFGRLAEKHLESKRAIVRLASGEVRYVALDACATIGTNSNNSHRHRMLGKAGRSRNMGIRPRVRGTAMNKVDHPHGGGRGKSKGNKIPRTPWGKPTKAGYLTRRGKNVNRMLIRGRPRGRQGASVRVPLKK